MAGNLLKKKKLIQFFENMTRKKYAKNEDAGKPGTDKTPDNKHIDPGTDKDEISTSDGNEEKPQSADNIGNNANKEPGVSEGTDKEALKLASAEAKLAEMQDRYLRLSAEFDNYRKRTLREKIDLTKHAGENILISLIPVMDDFERALKVMETAKDCAAMKEGIDLIYNKFGEFLRQNGIKEIESENNEFNVDLHEAVTKIPVEDEAMKGKVVEVIVKGYYLHDKVMRYSKVVVGE